MFRSFRGKKGFLKDERGVASLEFAYVAGPYFALVAAIFQTFLEQMYVSYLDRGVQQLAAELRTGKTTLASINLQAKLQAAVSGKLCPTPSVFAGFDCTKLQVQLYSTSNCSTNNTSTSCWSSRYSDFNKAVRLTPSYAPASSTSTVTQGTFIVGSAGSSQYLTVYYPFPQMSAIWDTAPTAVVNGQNVHGLMSTAMWINDPSVGNF